MNHVLDGLVGSFAATLGIFNPPEILSSGGDTDVALAWSSYVFGLYLLVVLTLFAFPPTGRKLRRLIRFPETAWATILFSVAIFVLALFYLTAARWNVRTLYWVSVFGRCGVLLACLWLWLRHQGHGVLLVGLGMIDFLWALHTGFLLVGGGPAGIILISGIGQMVTGLTIRVFPAELEQISRLGFWQWKRTRSNLASTTNEETERWATIFATVLTALGTYCLVAAIFDIEHYYPQILITRLLICLACAAVFFFIPLKYPNPANPTEDTKRRAWIVGSLGALELVATIALSWTISYACTERPDRDFCQGGVVTQAMNVGHRQRALPVP